MKTQTDIAIIGGGATATLVAHELGVRHGHQALIIDPADRPALGLAYGTRAMTHLLNVPASGMSAVADEPEHFLIWLRQTIDPAIAAERFIPRPIYGLYLQQMLTESGAQHRQAHVVACTQVEGGFRIDLDNGPSLTARRIVLALGHFPPAFLPGIPPEIRSDSRYHHQVWGDRTFENIGKQTRLLMIGSGLTAIDCVMQTRAAGHRGPIRLLSRHGKLPYAHDLTTPHEAPVLTPDMCPPRCTAYLRRFNQSLKGGLPWRAAIDSLRPVSNMLWSALPAHEHARFRRHLQQRWDVARHRIAPHVATALAQAIKEHTLVVSTGALTCIEPKTGGLRVSWKHYGRSESLEVDHILNCTGPDLRYERVNSPLLHGLIAQGLACPGPGGIGLATNAQGRLTPKEGMRETALYTLGPARLGTLFESIAIPEIRQQAHALAAVLAQDTS